MTNENEPPTNGNPRQRPKYALLYVILRALTWKDLATSLMLYWSIFGIILTFTALPYLLVHTISIHPILDMAVRGFVSTGFFGALLMAFYALRKRLLEDLNSLPPPDDNPPSYKDIADLSRNGKLEKIYPQMEVTTPEESSNNSEQILPSYNEAQELVTIEESLESTVTDSIMVPVTEMLNCNDIMVDVRHLSCKLEDYRCTPRENGFLRNVEEWFYLDV